VVDPHVHIAVSLHFVNRPPTSLFREGEPKVHEIRQAAFAVRVLRGQEAEGSRAHLPRWTVRCSVVAADAENAAN
jgi:hypothetical protein